MEKERHLKNISEIRKLMEQSSRFISLSGWSGIFSGLVALAGIIVAFKIHGIFFMHEFIDKIYEEGLSKDLLQNNSVRFVLLDAFLVLIIALLGAVFFTVRRSLKKNLPIWNKTTQKFLIHLFIPIIVGGIVCILLIFKYYAIHLVVPFTLIFYGLAVLNAGKYAVKELSYLGISEIILGLLALLFIGYGFIFWAIGFGILHIIYGTAMYNKYERK